jgi:hypothetical protein
VLFTGSVLTSVSALLTGSAAKIGELRQEVADYLAQHVPAGVQVQAWVLGGKGGGAGVGERECRELLALPPERCGEAWLGLLARMEGKRKAQGRHQM